MIRFLLLTSTILLYFAFKVPSPLRRTRPSADYLLLFARKKSAEVATSARAGRTLVIVESPAKAKTIQGFLDERQFVVDSCQGHVRDLPRAGKDAPPEFKGQYISQELGLKVADLGVQVHNNFEPIYTPLAAKGDIIKRLQVKAKKCDSILLATDEDREGEAISWHILELLQPSIPCERAVFHEITKDAILEAFDSPRTVDMNLVQSQETRRMLDRLTGYTLSPMLWRYLARGLSAGRVQSCGLYLLVEREKKRWAFRKSKYFSMEATFLDSDPSSGGSGSRKKIAKGTVLKSRLHQLNGLPVAKESDFDSASGSLVPLKGVAKKASSKALGVSDTDDVYPLVLGEFSMRKALTWLTGMYDNLDKKHDFVPPQGQEQPKYVVTNVDEKRLSRQPPLPFITSSLQQEASRRLGLSPSRTMSVAQELYENGFITYMRTDSPKLSETASRTAKEKVVKLFGKEYLAANSDARNNAVAKRTAAKKKDEADDSTGKGGNAPKNAQEAHEAIRPVGVDGLFRAPSQTGLTAQHKSLYALIYQRTLASVMTPSQSHTKTYTIEAENTGSPSSSSSSSSSSPVHAIDSEDGAAWEGYNVLPGEDIHLSVRSATFRCSHTVNTFPGFLAVYDLRDNGAYEPTPLVPISQVPVGAQVWLHDNDDSKDDEGDDDEDGISIDDGSEAVEGADRNNRKESSDAEETSDAVDVSFHGVRGISHVTRPPSRFTDASFIKELETVGVGRPSTYSKIFSILRERNYAFVSGRTMIPTITGLVVANLLEKHFADFIQPDFTASMEDALDDIAKGHVDKVKFLSSFYLGDQSNLGMLPKVIHAFNTGEIDQNTSRCIEIPFLRDIGPLSIGRSGAYITPHPNVVDIIKAKFGTDEEDTLYDPDNPICPVPDDTSNLDYADANADGYRPRWMLPQDMQLDLRALRREAVVRLIHDETTTSGEVLGYDPVTNESIALKTGRFGKYIQIGDNDDKNKRYAGAPQWLDKTVPFEGVLDIANLPKCIGMHPVLNLPIMVECYAKLLQVSIENFPIRVAAPYGALVSQITPEIATELLGDPEEILASQKILGTNEATGEVVMIRKGPYGFYLQCGARYCGLGKLNKDEVDLNLALETLEKRGKVRGEKKAKKKAAKAAAKGAKEDKDAKTKRKPKAKAKATQRLTKRAKERANVKKLNLAASKVKAVVRRTGYQIFSSESMKAGKSMKEVGAAWKELSDNKKAEYKAKAVAMMAASQNEEGSKATEASNTDGNTDGGAGDASPIARPKPKPKPKKQSSDLTNA